MGVVHLFGDVGAGARGRRVGEVAMRLRARGEQVSVLAATNPAAAQDAAQRAVDDGCERLIVVGGDGAVHLAVNAVADSATVLGIIPVGSGNDTARALGLLDGALDDFIDRALATSSRVDALRSDHGWVASVATLGFSGDVTDRAESLRRVPGSVRYTLATLLQLPRLRSIDVELWVDHERIGADTTLLAVGTTAWFGGGMKICPGARPNDGLLHAVSIGAVPRHRFLRLLPTVFSGRHVKRSEVATVAGRAALIDGPSDVMLWADGERLGPLPARIEIVPGALRVAGVELD